MYALFHVRSAKLRPACTPEHSSTACTRQTECGCLGIHWDKTNFALGELLLLFRPKRCTCSEECAGCNKPKRDTYKSPSLYIVFLFLICYPTRSLQLRYRTRRHFLLFIVIFVYCLHKLFACYEFNIKSVSRQCLNSYYITILYADR